MVNFGSRRTRWAVACIISAVFVSAFGITYVSHADPEESSQTTTNTMRPSNPPDTSTGAATTSAPPSPTSTMTQTPKPAAPDTKAWESWAIYDRFTANFVASPNSHQLSTPASTMKVWIAADFLGRLESAGREPTDQELSALRKMIRYSNNEVAHDLYAKGGGNAVLTRLVSTCNLNELSLEGSWATLNISAMDTARMGDCVANSRATSSRWTDWLMHEMRNAHPDSEFGLDNVRGDAWGKPAIKNGWNMVAGSWHISCLAIYDDISLAVQLQYPLVRGMQFGANRCRELSREVLRDNSFA